MITFNNNTDQFKPLLDRNGAKIHIGEHVIIKRMSKFISGTVCGFSNDNKYIYIIAIQFFILNIKTI